jgi:S-methyl-5-thioribose kinase
MDKVTAISFVLSVAKENCGVDIFQELSSIGQDKIEAVDISSPDLPNSQWRIHFGNKSILLKQSSPRQQVSSLEYDSLIAHYQTCPALVPRPYYWSPEQQSILLEDLRDYSVLYEELLNFRVDMPAIRKLSASLGQLHQQSHSASNSMVVRDLMKKFNNNPVATSEIQSRFVDIFSQEHVASIADEAVKSELSKLLLNDDMMATVTSLRNTVSRKKECLSHALLSTASVWVKDGQAKLVDGHNATFYGPCSFDVGVLLADYIVLYHEHMLTEADNDRHRQIAYKMIEACQETVAAYLEEMTISVDGRDQFVANLISDAAGICGLQLITRAVQRRATNTLSSSKAVEIIRSGQRLLTSASRIHDVSRLVNIALMLTF